MRIVLTGGGTGGHWLPFESVITGLRTQYMEQQANLPPQLAPKELEIIFVGPVDEEARSFFTQYDVRAVHVPSGKLRRYASGLNFIDILWRLPLGVLRALVRLYFLMPDVVIGMGGYGSIPAILAASFYRIPILLHEMDAVPGLANRKLARRASVITLGFASAKEALLKRAYKAVVTGNPVREDIHRLSRADARREFDIPESERVLLVTGGSQGAKQLNEILLQILPALVLDVTIIHLTGKDHFQTITAVAGELLAQSSRREAYKPFPILTDTMAHALVAADSIVARAGASTLTEIAALRRPALVIPLASAASDHQRANAQVFESAGAALVLDPLNLSQNLFENNVRRLITDPETREHLITNLQHLDQPGAARKISEIAFQLTLGFAPTREK